MDKKIVIITGILVLVFAGTVAYLSFNKPFAIIPAIQAPAATTNQPLRPLTEKQMHRILIHLRSTSRSGVPNPSHTAVAKSIALEIGAKIFGEYPYKNAYILEISTETLRDLDTVINKLKNDQRIVSDTVFADENIRLDSGYFLE
ncbi:MAG: hypothetical protein Q8Q94_01290 [bacterium]|nr:hypothetical protein [bacterium]MDZ4299384.1 hypothetical protein [Candidatus Sungbacteria bacterium]